MNNKVIQLSKPEVVSMADEWFEFSSPDHFWMKARFAKLLPFIKQSNPTLSGRYLEIGCGAGAFIQQLDAATKITTDGCDLNLAAIKMIGDIRGNAYVYDIHSLNPEMSSKYDGIFLLDVLEHIDDDRSFLKSALNYLKPGGMVFINVPALMSVFSNYDEVAGHKRRYSRSALVSLLTDSGLIEVRTSFWGFFLLPLLHVRKYYLRNVDKDKVIKAGFRPPSPVVNTLLRGLSGIENVMLKNPPIGTSLIAVGRKHLD